jgi:hypothetical protein
LSIPVFISGRNRPAVHILVSALFLLFISSGVSTVVFAQNPVFPGGFLETANSSEVRPRLTAAQIQALLPSRGLFNLPTPYNTDAIRITNGGDCGGNDCVMSVGYSYWANINNHVGSDTMLIFLGLNRNSGGGGPTLFSYNKLTDQVTKLGPLFDPSSPFSYASGEQWYFSATLPNALYILSGSKLLRYDVMTHQFTTVVDAASSLGPGVYLWQTHSSADDRVHAGTVRSSATYDMLGCFAYREDTGQFSYYPERGVLDECHLDKSGRWLVMLDNVDLLYGEDNRIIDLQMGTETLLLDQLGAAGHADMGYGYMVAEDNWAALPGAVRRWNLGVVPPVGLLVYAMTDWGAGVGHIAHGNAVAGVAPEQQYVCSSDANRADIPRANEIVCYRLDTSLDVLVVAPVMTDLDASGGGDDYSKRPKGNLDVTGRYFIWATNMGGGRQDAFVVKVPSHLLLGTGLDVTPPVVSIGAPSAGAVVTGSVPVTAIATDDVGVDGVQFRLDGASLGTEVTSPPWTVTWNTASAASGSHTLSAVARDAAGHSTVSAGVAVTVGNAAAPPLISSVAASGVSSTGATVIWTTDVVSDSQVEYGPTTGYGSVTPLQPSLVTAHVATLSGLGAETLYHYRVRSRDAAGQLSVSGDQTFTTPAAGGGLVGFWRFEESAGTALDSTPNHYDGTLVNGPLHSQGWSGQGLQFDGQDDLVNVPHRAALNGFPLTVVASVKTLATGIHGIVNKYYPSSLNGYQIFTNGGNLCAWYFRDASNYVYDGTSCTLAVPGYNDGNWHQVALVVDAAGGRLFVDGALKSSRPWTGSPGAASTTQELAFARYPGTATPYFPGTLDEVRVYDRALTAPDVQALFGAPPVISAVASSGITNSTASITWNTDTASDRQVEYGPTSSYGSSTTRQSTLATSHQVSLGGLTSGTTYHYRVVSRDATGRVSVSADYNFITTRIGGGPPLGNWRFEDVAGKALDSSANHFDGSLVNGPLWTQGWTGQGIQFDGANDFVKVPHRNALNAFPLTIVASVRTLSAGQQGIVNKYYAGSFNGYQLFTNGGNLCATYFRNASNYVYDGTECTLAVPGYNDGRWHQVAFVVDATGGRVFVDGVLKSSRAWTGTPGAPSNKRVLSFARYPGTPAPFLMGSLDEVSLYGRDLTAIEIKSLYDQAVAGGAVN